MSILPKIPYAMRKNRSQTLSFRGINYTNVTQEGDIADSKGISARAYPYITTRKARQKQGEFSNVTAMTVFNNKIVVVADGKLYWGGQEIGELTPGKKQFAPINTKLCIMPDKKYFDSHTMTLEDMGAEAYSLGATFTKNSVTMDEWWTERARGYGYSTFGNTLTIPKRVYAKKAGDGTRLRVYTEYDQYYYENSSFADRYIEKHRSLGKAKYEAHWHTERYGVDGIREYKRIIFTNGLDTQHISVGDWLWIDNIKHKVMRKPEESILDCHTYGYDSYFGRWAWGVQIRKSQGEREAEVYKIEELPEFIFNEDYIYINMGGTETVVPSLSSPSNRSLRFDHWSIWKGDIYYSEGVEDGFYDADVATVGWDVDFTKILTIGQQTTVKNASGNIFKSKITELTESTITFEDIIGDSLGSDNVHLIAPLSICVSEWDDGSEDAKNLGKHFKKGDCVTISGSAGNDMSFIVDGIDGLTLTASAEIFVEGEDTRFIMIERKIPDFDYICSLENRIWGCSNNDNTIYASALGDPTNFFINSGISTDSYAVAVGSEGRFTACCRFGSSVLFWKETKLHKILGSYPSEYTMYSYDFEGVQEGSHKSLQIINEVLYYKGIHGVYAFDSSPMLISSNFGDKHFVDAVAGVDGDSYYISMKDEEGRDYLFVFETLIGMWVLEDDVNVFDFARIGKDMYMLTEDGEFYLCYAKDTDPDIEWHVQLTPFYETLGGRKTYSRLLLRVELPLGSYLRVEVRADGRAWREAGKIVGKKQDVVPVIIPVNRCDKFEIRLSGKGKCTVMSILREFYVGGEK